MSKKDTIIKTSLEIFVEYGFHGAPVTKIIQAAEVSNGTFFYYFKTKEELITELYIETKKELYDTIHEDIQVDASVKKNIKALWKSWIIWGTNNKLKFNFLELFSNSPFVSTVDKEEIQKIYSFTGELLKKGIDDDILVNIDVNLLSELIYGSIRGTILYQQKFDVLSNEKLEEIFGLVWKSIV
ncbi:TetR/AcrR family transcriptional regulator [Clostridium sp.]|uniref:TetR/AcrR family transcriptional regulator n=1 Tax=Clostridium sp. TaxID=1506 RepID=UPI001A4282C6|nr:TetR/AcrR family transcriptional regulator [Clostridium sp.]MBK5242878.1 TetR/AcrR family transcriptional regulator [Clostridium sp.]